MPSLVLSALLLVPSAAVPQGGPVELRTRIEEVTVFPGQALVRRVGQAPAAGGELAIRGLPAAMDPDTVRVRCEGGDVVGLETRERVVDVVPSERVQELRERIRGLQRERRGLEDQRSLHDDVKGHLQRLLQVQAQAQQDEVAQGKADPEAWAANLAYVTEQLTATRRALREVEWQIEELDARIADVQADLGRPQPQVRLRDVLVDVRPRDGGALTVELEYLVGNAGWRPQYDLRAAPDARSVELSYRAKVWQRTGEDWPEVELLLSTARPNLGAQGPEPEPIWLRIARPEAVGRGAQAVTSLRSLGYDAGDTPPMEVMASMETAGEAYAPPPFAAVEDQGLSVRYRLATRETVESRDDPSTVLVGQARLDARPEYYVTPSLDTNVWLRGVATNSTEWTLLPGAASVFSGADFVGQAQVELVQPGQELTLHLGADPALTVERKLLEDLTEGPGLFGSRETQSETWLVKLENHGAAAVEPDGTAVVFVQEALPRSKDERIQVELKDARPKPSGAERWKQRRGEDGILTWDLRVPGAGGIELRYQVELSYPQGVIIVR